jgi:FAD/FMN-containing dehydrogenase
MNGVKNLEKLKENFRGRIIQAGDAGYDQARKVYNGMIDRRPGAIAQCADVADVIAAVNFGRDQGTLVAVRGGGHNGGGLGVCDDGLVIDLSLMKYTRVDPLTKTVRVGGGSTWGEVDHAMHPFGLATPAGIISTTGVGGLSLGGGVGHLTRKCGLTIDNILEVDMVLADGSFVTANNKRNEDLFWAVRGGGGNFGIVTSFLFKAHPVDTVVAGPMLWEQSQTAEVLQWYREFITDAPSNLNGFFAHLTVPPGPPFPQHLHLKKMCGIVWCYAGPPEKAEKAFNPVRRFTKPALELLGPMPYPALQSMFDALYPPGLQWYWRADFMKELSDKAIEIHAKYGQLLPSMHSSMHLYPVNGAASEAGNKDTPWAYRDATWAQVIVGVDPDPRNNDRITSWTKNYYNEMHPHSAGGAYVNFMMDEGEERVRATYKGNYERLAKIKRRYDRENFFRVNQNIKPTS